MGVPKLFHTLIQQYHHNDITNPTGFNIIKPNINLDLPTYLYLDFNGAIYQCIKSGIKTEETLILHVLQYLDTLCLYVPNVTFIYIALDGVAPLGKIKNQRERRFHSICRNKRIQKLIEKYGSSIDIENATNACSLDTNMITPGTHFMYNLSNALKQHLSTNVLYNNKQIIFSDSSISGEGEHKIIKYIRTTTITTHLEHNTVIYGMDGDLIFLALSLNINNIYLFRESGNYGLEFNNKTSYLYLDITELTLALITHFKKCYSCNNIDNTRQYIDDYIFLGMLLGNDFIPKTHWFSIGENGFDRLLSAYWQIHNHTELFLVDARDKMIINTEMLCDIMYIVKEQENESITTLLKKRAKMKIHIKSEMNELERQQTLIDFYPLQYLHIEQNILPINDTWRERYYKICHHLDYNSNNLQMICQSYLKTLVWTFHYYFNDCLAWDWVYNFDYAPTWHDLYNELLQHKNINTAFTFNKSEPLNPQTVLFMVLPWQSRHFMAEDIQKKLNQDNCSMNIYFPKRYALNIAFNRYYHECTPIIYKMDLIKINKFINSCKFTDNEQKRNKLDNHIFILNCE